MLYEFSTVPEVCSPAIPPEFCPPLFLFITSMFPVLTEFLIFADPDPSIPPTCEFPKLVIFP